MIEFGQKKRQEPTNELLKEHKSLKLLWFGQLSPALERSLWCLWKKELRSIGGIIWKCWKNSSFLGHAIFPTMKNGASSKIRLQRMRQTKLKIGCLNIALISSLEKN